MVTGITYRKANTGDAQAIADIWNEGIEDGNATFEINNKDMAWTTNWLLSRDPRYSVLVADNGNSIAGWLSLNPFSQRDAYRFVADISIYVGRNYRKKGIGSAILDHGIMEAKNNNFHKLVLTMIYSNEPAKKLFMSHGGWHHA